VEETFQVATGETNASTNASTRRYQPGYNLGHTKRDLEGHFDLKGTLSMIFDEATGNWVDQKKKM
jgi:hypothetical protein